MKLLIAILFVTSSVSVFALDPFLKSSSGSKCYYDDGSVIDNGGRICPTRLNLSSLDRDWPSLTKKKTAEQIQADIRFREATLKQAQSAGTGLRLGLGAVLGADTRTNSEVMATKVSRQLVEVEKHKKRMRDLEYQRVLLEIEALKKQAGDLSEAPTRAIDFALPKPVKSSDSILTGVGIFCDVTSVSGRKTRMFYASACPVGATQVD